MEVLITTHTCVTPNSPWNGLFQFCTITHFNHNLTSSMLWRMRTYVDEVKKNVQAHNMNHISYLILIYISCWRSKWILVDPKICLSRFQMTFYAAKYVQKNFWINFFIKTRPTYLWHKNNCLQVGRIFNFWLP